MHYYSYGNRIEQIAHGSIKNKSIYLGQHKDSGMYDVTVWENGEVSGAGERTLSDCYRYLIEDHALSMSDLQKSFTTPGL